MKAIGTVSFYFQELYAVVDKRGYSKSSVYHIIEFISEKVL